MKLYVIADDDEPGELGAQLEAACRARQVSFELVDALALNPSAALTLEPGSMLYRIGISATSCVVEQLLAHERVATMYADPLGPHIIHDTQLLYLARCGVATPRAFHVLTDERAELRAQVEALGGFPVVLKIPGYSLGVGVMRLADEPALFSVVDMVLATHGPEVTLMSCIEPAEHWRVITVGDEVTCAYINVPDDDGFRTHVDEARPELFERPTPAPVLEQARRASAALGLEFGGVDVLAHPSGRAYVLEVNFPCYFAHPWRAAKIDVAGAMLEHLIQKAHELRTTRP